MRLNNISLHKSILITIITYHFQYFILSNLEITNESYLNGHLLEMLPYKNLHVL